ncbi:MAG: FAD-dependent oxidoreductase [Alphaproteobacteria bacterium]|nr:FAD-dependent oxidoreductase [Alphaproteobacteria bacterium]
MHIVIIGGSTTAIGAAAHLRRNLEKATITLVAKSPDLGEALCGIPQFLGGHIAALDDLQTASAKLLEKTFKLRVLLNTEVIKIDPQRQILHYSANHRLYYDKLLLADEPLRIRPDIKGILSDNIFTLHNASAAQRVNDYFWGLNAKRILILGGGMMGVQTAVALAQNGGEVTIADHAGHILKYADEEFAKYAEKIMQNHNIKTITSTKMKEFSPLYAIFNNGKKIPYDMAIIATGSQPDMRLPITTGILSGEGGGIAVDCYMQTNIKNIYACGNGVELKNSISGQPFRISNAVLAAQSAKAAADNISGITKTLPRVFNNEIIRIFDYYLGVCGASEEELQNADIDYRKVYVNSERNENYIVPTEKLWLKLLFSPKGEILGTQIWGKSGVFTRLNIVAAYMQHKGSVQDLSEFYIAYTPQLAKTKDILAIAATLAVKINDNRLRVIRWKELQKQDIVLNVGAKITLKDGGFEVWHIPFGQLREHLRALPKDRIIALFCRNGYSAYLAYCLMSQSGFDNVYLLNDASEWDEIG